MITEMPGPFSEYSAGFDDKSMAQKGVHIISRQDITISGYDGILLHEVTGTIEVNR